MKKHLTIYAVLIAVFIIYNLFFKIEDDRTNTAVNILFASVLFGYIGFMAFVLMKKMRKNK
ncbi:MAG: hypothetical protein QM564_05445 [Bergeyella sp.]